MKNNGESELNAIREGLYEEIKEMTDMTPSKMSAFLREKVEPVEKKHNIHAVSWAKPIKRRISQAN